MWFYHTNDTFVELAQVTEVRCMCSSKPQNNDFSFSFLRTNASQPTFTTRLFPCFTRCVSCLTHPWFDGSLSPNIILPPFLSYKADKTGTWQWPLLTLPPTRTAGHLFFNLTFTVLAFSSENSQFTFCNLLCVHDKGFYAGTNDNDKGTFGRPIKDLWLLSDDEISIWRNGKWLGFLPRNHIFI